MRYFIMHQNPFFSGRFSLHDWQEKIDVKQITFQGFHKVPRQCVLTADIGDYVPFPDIVTAPFLLFSNMLFHIAELYGEPIYSRDVVVINSKDQSTKHYYLVLVDEREDEAVKWKNRNLFYINVRGKRELVVSLDFAESMLRRGAVGVALEEVKMEGILEVMPRLKTSTEKTRISAIARGEV